MSTSEEDFFKKAQASESADGLAETNRLLRNISFWITFWSWLSIVAGALWFVIFLKAQR